VAAGIGEPREANFVGLESGFDGVVVKRGARYAWRMGLNGEPLAAIEIGSESGAEGYASSDAAG